MVSLIQIIFCCLFFFLVYLFRLSFIFLSEKFLFPSFTRLQFAHHLILGSFFSWFICFVCHAFFFEFISREFAQNTTTTLPLIQVTWVRWVTFRLLFSWTVFSGITPYTFGFLLSDLMDFRITLSLIFSLHLASLLTQQLYKNRYFCDCGHHLAFTVFFLVLAIFRAGRQWCGKDQVDFQFKFMIITNSAGPTATNTLENIFVFEFICSKSSSSL